jgi:hypothetical protein
MPLFGSPKEKMATEMHKFGTGKLHSGSTKGPVVTNSKQAIAISLHESGLSKKKPDHTLRIAALKKLGGS